MTISYWIREHGNGAYCVGKLPDGAYDSATCILVVQRPSPAHTWDNNQQRWVISLDRQKAYIKPLAGAELRRTDKYMISDFNATFTAQEKAEIIAYRQTLRNLPNQTSIEEMVMPPCPEFMKE